MELRMLLHSGSPKLARLARNKLFILQTAIQGRPEAIDETTFRPFRPRIPPQPAIEGVGRMFLGKEFILVDTRYKDDFVSAKISFDTCDLTTCRASLLKIFHPIIRYAKNSA